MNKKSLFAMLVTGGIIASGVTHADHNSVWGPGSANMPNDIHNTRIEDDQETFMDLVQYGDGADSVNRYDDELDTMTSRMGGSSTVTRSMSMSTRTTGMVRAGGRR
ncbi:MAG: hypothetical protein P8Y24_07720 [Gammaproteobacteria bacterium]|jgi:hypothetical protein